MGMTAENLAVQYDVTRAESDEYSLGSQQRYAAAAASGIFVNEIVPITVKTRKGNEVVDSDEHPRGGTTLADLSKLRPVFKEGGAVTAGSASGICDGAASLVIASDAACKEHSLRPLSRMVAWSRVGCEPSCMGIGPVAAITNALAVSGLTLDQMDLIEINEAFAVQYLACEKALGLDRSKVNVNGGAIAIGHPLGEHSSTLTNH